jgi:hypothetical protein
MNLESFSNILGAETIKKVYEDGLSEPVKESGKILTDLIKSFRLFTAPFQYTASYQDRLTKHLSKVIEGVPVERQIEAPASISGPIMERLKYLEDDNYLTDLYISLLQKAIDKERINEAHPAFFHIIDQLSPDEAMILYSISEKPIEYDYVMDLIKNENGESRFDNLSVVLNTLPKEKLNFTEHFEMYISHLESLNLIKWSLVSENPIWKNGEEIEKKTQSGTYRNTSIYTTKFGKLFIKACIPKTPMSRI